MSDMDEFEQYLSKRLRRVDASALLVGAVMSRVAKEPRRITALPQQTLWMARLAALFLITAIAGSVVIGSLHHRRAAERAKAERDFARSQELISRALEPVRRQLGRVGFTVDE